MYELENKIIEQIKTIKELSLAAEEEKASVVNETDIASNPDKSNAPKSSERPPLLFKTGTDVVRGERKPIYYVKCDIGFSHRADFAIIVAKWDENALRYYYMLIYDVRKIANEVRKAVFKNEDSENFKSSFAKLKNIIDFLYSINTTEDCDLVKNLGASGGSHKVIDFDIYRNMKLKLSNKKTLNPTVHEFYSNPSDIYKKLLNKLNGHVKCFTNKDFETLGKPDVLKIPEEFECVEDLDCGNVKEIDFGSVNEISGKIKSKNLSVIRFGSEFKYIGDDVFSSSDNIKQVYLNNLEGLKIIFEEFKDRANKIKFYINEEEVNLNGNIDKDDIKIEFSEGKLVIPDGVFILDKETFDKIIEKLGIGKDEIEEIDFNQVLGKSSKNKLERCIRYRN